MKTISLTEFNQNPSQATRLADSDELIILRRGQAAYRLERIRESSDDPVEALIRAGKLAPPRRNNRSHPRSWPVAPDNVDLGAMLDADRGRLDR